MRLTEGMLLFHGSYTPVETINLALCSDGKDFGREFYVTSDVNQAKNFLRSVVDRAHERALIPLNQDYGFVSSYRLRMPKDRSQALKIHTLKAADREWLWFVAYNRRRKQLANISPQIEEIARADIVVGKIANDKTNPVITTYLNGLYGDIFSEEAIQEAIKRLIPNHLVDQYCFLTQRALQCLVFQEARKYVIR